MDERSEWRSFTLDEEKESCSIAGMPFALSMHNKGLSTEISSAGLDARGNELPLKPTPIL